MKRTKLTRKTPLKRSLKPMKRTRLKPQSTEKAAWTRRYNEAKDNGSSHVRPANMPFVVLHKDECDPHHPFGRRGERILAFLWVTKEFHRQIHDFSKWAWEQGWLQPQYRGMLGSAGWPRPWKKDFESKWPINLRRP